MCSLREEMLSELDSTFPTTLLPNIFPSIQNKIVSWKKPQSNIGFSLGPAGQHVLPDSLLLAKSLLSVPLPKRTLTISVATDNFKVGASCVDFVPKGLSKLPAGSFFTYQMLSRHCQATYFNHNDVEFLAGICYYLQPVTDPESTCDIDSAAFNFARVTADLWPVQNRWEYPCWKSLEMYGRYCKTAQRRVMVRIDDKGVVRHFWYNFRTEWYTGGVCEECHKDYEGYQPPSKGQARPSIFRRFSTFCSQIFSRRGGIIENDDDIDYDVTEAFELDEE